MVWRVKLSNNEVVDEVNGDFGSWRRLKEKCDREGLSIRTLGIVSPQGFETPSLPHAVSFFVVHEVVAVVNGPSAGIATFKKGLGCIYNTVDGEKVRVQWYAGDPLKRIHAQVGWAKHWDVAKEMGIKAANE